MNQTLLNMLKTLPENSKSDWKSQIKKLTFTYNDIKNKTKGFLPHFCLFRQHGLLPKHLDFGLLETKSEKSYQECIENQRNSIKGNFSIISRNVQ